MNEKPNWVLNFILVALAFSLPICGIISLVMMLLAKSSYERGDFADYSSKLNIGRILAYVGIGLGFISCCCGCGYYFLVIAEALA